MEPFLSWLLIYNLPLRIGGWVWKERKVVANLQPPLEDWRVGMEGKESGR